MDKLWYYQEDAVDAINETMDESVRRILYQLPTGGGKTRIACEIAKQWPTSVFDPQVYWLTHRKELEKQSTKRLIEADVSSAIVSSPVRMNNAIKKGKYHPGGDSLLIADEAHHASAPTWERIVKSWPGTVLGLTATPWRLSKKEGFDHLFDHLIIGPPTQELIDGGFLVPTIVRHPKGKRKTLFDPQGTSVSGDYSETETYENNSKVALIDKAVDWLLEERNPNSRTVCYTLNVVHAYGVHKCALKKGLKSAVILGETPEEERDKAVKDFSEGKLNLLVCVEVITEGFDVPMIDSILMLRPTQSLSLYLQMIGRSMRAAPGKKHALILDGVGNWQRHGLPEDDRSDVWQLEARGEPGEKGEFPIRSCKKCKCLNHAASRVCKACGHVMGEECQKCGTFIFEEEVRMENDDGSIWCVTCDDNRQNDMFEAGIGTIISGKPYELKWLNNEWGVKCDARVPKETIALVTSRRGYRWFTMLTKLVGKDGRSYLYQTDGTRKFTKRASKEEIAVKETA